MVFIESETLELFQNPIFALIVIRKLQNTIDEQDSN